MAYKKITDLTAATTPLDAADLVEIVQDVGGTPVSRKAALGDLSSSSGGPVGGVTVSDLHGIELDDAALFWNAMPTGGPHAVFDTETGRSWFAYTKSGGDLYASYYDHTTGDIATPVLVAAYPWASADFHHIPAVMMDADGIMHIIYGGHNADAHRHYRMNNARDLSAWTGQTLQAGTYPFACTTDDGELIFTDRPSDVHDSTFPAHEYGAIYRCTDGSTWTRTELIDTTGTPETHSDFYQCDITWAADRVHLLWTVARGSAHDGDKTDLYYAAFDPDTGTLYNAAGTSLGATIDWTDHTSCLVATVAASERIRACVEWHRGAPAVAFTATGETDLVVALWDGSAWVETAIPNVTATGPNQPVLKSTPDELILVAHAGGQADDRDITHWRLFDGTWEIAGRVLDNTTTNEYSISPLRDGPSLAVALGYDSSGGFPGNVDNVVGTFRLVTDHHHADGAAVDHSHDYAASDHTHSVDDAADVRDAGVWEVIVSGTAPPVAVTNEDQDDWLYGWVGA